MVLDIPGTFIYAKALYIVFSTLTQQPPPSSGPWPHYRGFMITLIHTTLKTNMNLRRKNGPYKLHGLRHTWEIMEMN